MHWSVAVALPIILASFYWHAISCPWFCAGLCCLLEASCAEVTVRGRFDPKYNKVVQALGHSLVKGWDLGASLYVAVDGETVVDGAGGFKDTPKTIPYDEDTVNLVFSSGKVIETIGVAILVDKGLVELDVPMTTYWPEFGEKNKGDITIKDMLSHRSGSICLFEETPSLEILQDPQARDNFLASQKFLYPRGTVGYRGWCSALYSDAICRRVDPKRRSLVQLVQDEIFGPLNETFFCPPVPAGALNQRMSEVHDISISTMLLGVLPQLFLPSFYRTVLGENHLLVLDPTELVFFQKAIWTNDPDAPFGKPTIPNVDQGAASYNNRSSFLSYDMMSANCISNARSLGKALGAFMGGNVVGQCTLSSFVEPFPPAFDIFWQQSITHLAGGFAKDALIDSVDNADCAGWFGLGGSMVVHCAVGEHSVTFSYVPNGLAPRLALDRGMFLLKDVIEVVLN